MPKPLSATDMRKMKPAELRKEIDGRRSSVAKIRIGITMRSHKDTAQFRREKKDLARMLTVLGELENANSTLKANDKNSTVPAFAEATAGKSASAPKKSAKVAAASTEDSATTSA